jgi:RNA polymerase sigma-70 factor (ECF subfamily)
VELVNNQMLRFSESDARTEDASEDARLLAQIAEGDERALAALYKRRGRILYSLLARMLVNEHEAQEVLQDAFVLIWRRARLYDPVRSSPLGWMIMLTRGRAMDILRARSRRAVGHAAYEQEIVSLDMEVNGRKQIERDDLSAACAVALKALPEAQSRALELAFFRGWTHQQIAGAVGEPLGTIKARIRRGLLALRQILKDYHA